MEGAAEMTVLQYLHHVDQSVTLAVNSLSSPFTDRIWMFFSDIPVWIPLYVIVAFFLFAAHKRTIFPFRRHCQKGFPQSDQARRRAIAIHAPCPVVPPALLRLFPRTAQVPSHLMLSNESYRRLQTRRAGQDSHELCPALRVIRLGNIPEEPRKTVYALSGPLRGTMPLHPGSGVSSFQASDPQDHLRHLRLTHCTRQNIPQIRQKCRTGLT